MPRLSSNSQRRKVKQILIFEAKQLVNAINREFQNLYSKYLEKN